jgi:lipopolysaccharide/colanic/teichoic acid biosynthesis glycosyltransferase
MDSDAGRKRMIGIIIAVILVILLGGILLHLLKIAIIIALAVGIVMFAQNKLGTKRIK